MRLIAVILLFLAGCGTLRVPDSAPTTIVVTWHRVSKAEVAFYCQGATARLRSLTGQHAVACTDAMPARGICTIYSERELELSTLGDEVAHCFLGAWHH